MASEVLGKLASWILGGKYTPPTSDPFTSEEYHAESTTGVAAILFGWTGDCGTFSTKREQSVWYEGFLDGRATGFLGQFRDCPWFWTDEEQYFGSGQIAGYFAKMFTILIVVETGGVSLLMSLGGVL